MKENQWQTSNRKEDRFYNTQKLRDLAANRVNIETICVILNKRQALNTLFFNKLEKKNGYLLFLVTSKNKRQTARIKVSQEKYGLIFNIFPNTVYTKKELNKISLEIKGLFGKEVLLAIFS